MDTDDPRAAFDVGLRLLARREHSRRELARKLEARRFTAQARRCALDALEAAGYLDEPRFAAMVTRHRCAAAYGPLRVRAELAQHGVADDVVDAAIATLDTRDWVEAAARWLARRMNAVRAGAHRAREDDEMFADALGRPSGREAMRSGAAKGSETDTSERGGGRARHTATPPIDADPEWIEARAVQLCLARGFTPDQAKAAWAVVVAGDDGSLD